MEAVLPDGGFPDRDAWLRRTLVFDHPSDTHSIQVLVSIYADGSIEVAQRTNPGATWGPPWSIREAESWS
jgi:hypothetical protein